MPLPKINAEYVQSLPPKERREVEKALAELERIYQDDPLQSFEPNCSEQEKFLLARTKTQAAFAGNQSGKTTALVVKSLIQHIPADQLPERLRPYKFSPEGLVMGRIVAPAINERIMATFRQWCPKHILKDGLFDKSWEKQDKILRFADGGFIDFLSYETDLDKFGSVQRHYVGYDEPPPQDIRDEGLYRLVRFNGPELFAMTPLKANTGWIKKEIWRQRESPKITVCKWSIHDNSTLSKEAVEAALEGTKNDLWRRAREFGDFVDVGGLMYPRFEDWVLKDVPVDPAHAMDALRDRVQELDIVVGIDPGWRNAAFVWVGFDRDNRALVFHEERIQQKAAKDYAATIRRVNAQWGLKEQEMTFVIDPSRRSRNLVDGRNVEDALVQEGIYCVPGQNDIEAGVMQVNQRGNEEMLEISPAMVGLREEADLYAMEDREDGEFKEKRNDNSHRLDCLRYVCMYRTWTPDEPVNERAPLGWTPGTVPALNFFDRRERAALGDLS